MVKPFQFPELLARVRSRAATNQAPMQDVLRVADLELDASRHRAFRGRVRINLTTKEFALLHLLMRRNGDVITGRRSSR